MLRTELVTESSGLAALAAAWADLWARCPGATPFQSPAWLRPWWRAFGEGELRVIVTYDDGRLVGLAPLYVYTGDGRRRLFLIGSGNTDYLDVLVAPGFATEVGLAWAPWFARLAAEVDDVELQQLPPGATWDEIAPPGGRFAAHDACPLITYGPELYTSHVYQDAAYEWRRAARRGTLEVEAARADTVDALFDDLVRAHSARWRERGEGGVLGDARTRGFLREAARQTFAAGTLHLCALRFDGRRVATLLAFRRGPRAYLYLSGFAPGAAKLSPSKLLMWSLIEDTRADGVTALDLLRGQEAYKYRWGAVDRWNRRWVADAQRPAPAPTSTASPAKAEPLSTEAGW